jgi:hypothetical protein
LKIILKNKLATIQITFDADGVEYENILDYKPIMDLFNNFLIKLKKICLDYMLTNDDMYRLKYVLDSSHIKETVNIRT